jgi:hypothetical protein
VAAAGKQPARLSWTARRRRERRAGFIRLKVESLKGWKVESSLFSSDRASNDDLTNLPLPV